METLKKKVLTFLNKQEYVKSASLGMRIKHAKEWLLLNSNNMIQSFVFPVALCAAVVCNDKEMAATLLNFGVEADSGADIGYTPLMWAVLQQDAEMTRLLLQYGAKPYQENYRGDSAYSIAKTKDYSNILNIFKAA